MIREEKILFYMHGGSGNHGCEAIVNSLAHMLCTRPMLVTNSAMEDEKYSLRDICSFSEERQFTGHKLMHVLYYIWRKVTNDSESFIRYRYHAVFGKHFYPLAISVGGDNYCYENMLKDLRLANNAFNQRGTKTVLFGCSVAPEMLEREEIRRDLKRYYAIIARESVSFHALEQAFRVNDKGKESPRLFLYPDPAFTLKGKELPLPSGFAVKNTVGINISPMIQDNEREAGITMANYEELLRHIIRTTDMQIALIPHVVWERSDDRLPMQKLYETFKDTGRVLLTEDGTCEELKGYIARCRLFIGARTHATIAAYSSLVPTLVVGYSVKAHGIAQDLFGTSENYVLPVQKLQKKEELIQAFEWLKGQEDSIRAILEKVMPEYQQSALLAGKEVEKIWAELNMRQKI